MPPTKGLLSLFGADGLTFYPMSVIQRRVSFREAYKDPGNMYKNTYRCQSMD